MLNPMKKEISKIIVVILLGAVYALTNMFVFDSLVHIQLISLVQKLSMFVVPSMILIGLVQHKTATN